MPERLGEVNIRSLFQAELAVSGGGRKLVLLSSSAQGTNCLDLNFVQIVIPKQENQINFRG
eukprot:scaffold331_cov191-Alexandrium_tamarense.AAC.8